MRFYSYGVTAFFTPFLSSSHAKVKLFSNENQKSKIIPENGVKNAVTP
mgnify:FL=1